MRHVTVLALILLFPGAGMADSTASADLTPRYKPSSRAPEALDITTNAYGYSRTAPGALGIGDQPAQFVLPRAGGGDVSLADKLAAGPVVLIFYRGHW